MGVERYWEHALTREREKVCVIARHENAGTNGTDERSRDRACLIDRRCRGGYRLYIYKFALCCQNSPLYNTESSRKLQYPHE